MASFTDRNLIADETRREAIQPLDPSDVNYGVPRESNAAPFDGLRFGDNKDNGDEALYAGDPEFPWFGTFSKGLPHDDRGRVVGEPFTALWSTLDNARAAGTKDALAAIESNPLITLGGDRKWVNPTAGLSFDPQGADGHALSLPPAPRVDSERAAAEMVELYWMALVRDVPFTRYHVNRTVHAAAAELNRLSTHLGQFGNPATAQITPANMFRGSTAGDGAGRYLSQFLLLPIPYGTLTIDQRQKTAAPRLDYGTSFETWLDIQNGVDTRNTDTYDTVQRHIRNLRDLATYVHMDQLHEAYFNAALILLGMNAPFDDGNPYKTAKKQEGFGVLGGPHLLSLVTEVAPRALKAVWKEKWLVHRRLRPEEYAGRLQSLLENQGPSKGGTDRYVHRSVVESDAIGRIQSTHGNRLLPLAFPEGSPTHPAYGAGHATVAGACVTILKAWFEESTALQRPMIPDDEGTRLIPDPAHPALTVGGELDKLAANISIGRNAAGVHWRTDYSKSVALGEAVALGVLRHHLELLNETTAAFSLTTFSGAKVRVTSEGVTAL